MSTEARVALGCTGFWVFLITSIVLFSVSFGVVTPTQMGIVFNGNTQHLEYNKLWGSGRYLVGLGKSFIVLPTTYETVLMTNDSYGEILVRSFDGLEVSLEIAFQYVLSRNVSDAIRLYLDFAHDYEAFYAQTAMMVARDVASGYYGFDFFTKRDEIADKITIALDLALQPAYASVPALELLDMRVNPSLQDAIETTQVAVQDVQQAQYEQVVATIQADQALQVATQLAQVRLLTANMTAHSVIANATAAAGALIYRAQQQVTGLLALRSSLSLNTSAELLTYSWLNALTSSGAKNLIMSLDLPESLASTL